MSPTYFDSASAFRAWLEAHGATARELWVGFYKKASGRGGITYPEAVDEALCHGWIDGVKKRVDDLAYCHRFSPRQASSNWSAANVRRAEELIAA
ncbi:MAG: YdeI/OmpD-associated family protein, partial [Candidatus Rokuibacteriota bacterium]